MKKDIVGKGILKIWLLLLSVILPVNFAQATLPVVERLSYESYPERIRVTFSFSQPVKLVVYTIKEPSQIIADIMGEVAGSIDKVPKRISINEGEIKSIKAFEDESIKTDCKDLYGVDFFIIELDKMVDFALSKKGNIYYLDVAKSENIHLTESLPAESQKEPEIKGSEAKDKTEQESEVTPEEEIKQKIETTKKKGKDTRIKQKLYQIRQKKEEKTEEGQIEARGTKLVPGISKEELAEYWRNKGYSHQKEKDYNKAIDCYKKAIDFNPNYACAYNDLGIVYFYLNQPEKAIEQFEKAIEIDPNYLGAYTNLALTYENLGNNQKAIEYWEKRIELSKKEDYWTKKAKERIRELKNK